MASSSQGRNAPMLVTVVLLVLAVALIVVGAVYAADTAGHLPSFFPGHQAGSAHKHTKHALLAFALAVVALLAAWFSSGKKSARS